MIWKSFHGKVSILQEHANLPWNGERVRLSEKVNSR